MMRLRETEGCKEKLKPFLAVGDQAIWRFCSCMDILTRYEDLVY